MATLFLKMAVAARVKKRQILRVKKKTLIRRHARGCPKVPAVLSVIPMCLVLLCGGGGSGGGFVPFSVGFVGSTCAVHTLSVSFQSEMFVCLQIKSHKHTGMLLKVVSNQTHSPVSRWLVWI